MAHIPEDRHKHGLILDYILSYNAILQRYFTPKFQSKGFLRNNEIKPYAENDIRIDLVIRAISVHEGFSVTDTEVSERINEYVNEYGYDDVEHFLRFSSETSVRTEMLAEMVIDLIMEHAIPN